MKVEKCQVGYISHQKKTDWIWLAAFVFIGIAIFLTGYFWTHTRANVFTVVAVLMVLPAARRIVSLIVFLPRKGVAAERRDRILEKAGEGTLFSEYVFTSTEKIMHLDFLLIIKGNVLAVTAPSPQDVEYMRKYVEDNVHRIAPEYHVKIFESDERLLKYLEKLASRQGAGTRDEKLIAHMRSLAV